MELSNEQIKGYIRRLLLSRMRILNTHGFYGLLLMHMVYAIDENAETAYTDGTRIAFGPKFLESLTDSELDFVMMHEILHVVLQHCIRGKDRDHERMNIACDIVVNSNILLENNNDRRSITLSQWGESMHIAPDGKEGHEYTAEQVYDMLPPTPPGQKPPPPGGFAKGRAKQEQGKLHARKAELEEIAAEGKDISVTCQFCDVVYEFNRKDLEELKKAQKN